MKTALLHTRTRSASAMVGVLIFLGLVSVLSLATAQAVHHLRTELKRIELKQQMKFKGYSPAPANHP